MKWISRNEAADILGVHPQSISNYAEKGYVRKMKKGPSNRGGDRFCQDDVLALCKYSQRLQGIEQIEASISDMEKEISEKYTYTFNEYKRRRAEFLVYLFGRHNSYGRYIDLFRKTVDACIDIYHHFESDYIDDKIFKSVKLLANGWALEDIAQELSLNIPGVIYRIERGIKLLDNIPARAYLHWEAKYDEARAENEHLKKENKRLCMENAKISSEIMRLNSSIDLSNDRHEMCVESYDSIYTTPIRALGFTARTEHCLRAANIEIVAHLCCFKRYELLKLRNLGKKSIDEIDSFMAGAKLQYGQFETYPGFRKIV